MPKEDFQKCGGYKLHSEQIAEMKVNQALIFEKVNEFDVKLSCLASEVKAINENLKIISVTIKEGFANISNSYVSHDQLSLLRQEIDSRFALMTNDGKYKNWFFGLGGTLLGSFLLMLVAFVFSKFTS